MEIENPKNPLNITKPLEPEEVEQLKKLDEKIEDAKKNLGDVETRDAIIEKAEYYESKKRPDEAIKTYQEAMKYTLSIGRRMDLIFAIMKIELDRNNLDEVKKNVAKCHEFLEAGGDWERKNKLKVYEGVYRTITRDFKGAAKLFIDSLATFTAAEIMSFNDLVLYTAVTGIISLERAEIKKKIIHSSEVLSVIRDIPHLKQFLEAFYKCDYQAFFDSMLGIIELIGKDKYLKAHKKYLVREIRIVIYSQFLESYKTVTLANMAKAFGVSSSFIDAELSEFIATKKIACKIDKVAGVVESEKVDDRNKLYHRAIREGDALINRIQKLSRVIEH